VSQRHPSSRDRIAAVRQGRLAMVRWEYATLEWVWEAGSIRLNLPGSNESLREGSYNEVVALLCELGRDCWEVSTTVASADWIYWTLRRPLE
jgi:hypothetical protein